MSRAVLVLVVALCLCAGCGGGGSGSGSDATKAQRDIQPAAQQRAESMLLVLSDVPDGWRAFPADPGDARGEQKFRKCLGVDFSERTVIGDAASKDFAAKEPWGDDSGAASSSTQIFKSPDEAQTALAEFAAGMDSTAAKGCVKKYVGEKLAKIDVGELNVPAPKGVDETKAWQVVLSLSVKSGQDKGKSVVAYLDDIELRKGDAVSELQDLDTTDSFDADVRSDLAQKLADKMSSTGTTTTTSNSE